MCPGGRVVAATSEPGRVVTNGMSQYSRKEFNANSGLVVGIDPERDYPGHPLAGIDLQRQWESIAYAAGGGSYVAPGQRVEDFLAGRASTAFGEVIPSYKPGVLPTDLAPCLPSFAVEALREALPAFGRQIARSDHPDAMMTGVETRTSSPVSIRRGKDFRLNTRGRSRSARAPLCGRYPLRRRRHQGGGGVVSACSRQRRTPTPAPRETYCQSFASTCCGGGFW